MIVAIATLCGRSPFAPASSIQAKAARPTAAGQRPSRSGYARGASNASPAALVAIHATPRAAARHGLKARKTSPKTALTGTSPTRKTT